MKFAAVKAGRGLTERAACKRLARLAADVPAEQVIVELGAFQGRTTAWLAWGSSAGKGARVFSVDPWTARDTDPEYAGEWEPGYARGDYADPDTLTAYRAHLISTGADRHVTSIQATSTDAGQTWDGPAVGLLWHDAQHTAEAVHADLVAWMPHMAKRAVIALHDACHPAYGVIDGARAVLDRHVWSESIYPWAKKPDRRGMVVYRR